MKLLIREQEKKAHSNESNRLVVRDRLRGALHELLPGQVCWVYGSITKPGRFREWSDVDLAIEDLPAGISIYDLISRLSERIGRNVDLVILGETRLSDKIVREGERWIA